MANINDSEVSNFNSDGESTFVGVTGTTTDTTNNLNDDNLNVFDSSFKKKVII